MEVTIDIPEYDPKDGLRSKWIGDWEIETAVENGEILISANKDGLLSLAAQLLILAQDDVPVGNHHHYGPGYGLEKGSVELVIEKKGN